MPRLTFQKLRPNDPTHLSRIFQASPKKNVNPGIRGRSLAACSSPTSHVHFSLQGSWSAGFPCWACPLPTSRPPREPSLHPPSTTMEDCAAPPCSRPGGFLKPLSPSSRGLALSFGAGQWLGTCWVGESCTESWRPQMSSLVLELCWHLCTVTWFFPWRGRSPLGQRSSPAAAMGAPLPPCRRMSSEAVEVWSR